MRRWRVLPVAAILLASLAAPSTVWAQPPAAAAAEAPAAEGSFKYFAFLSDDRSLAMSDSLDCTSTITVDSHISASCVGIADSGQAVAASFSGTADVDAETCTALLVVDIGGHRIIDQPYVQCFDTA